MAPVQPANKIDLCSGAHMAQLRGMEGEVVSTPTMETRNLSLNRT
jgi:hypothetical protein